MELSQEIKDMIRDYASKFTCSAYESIKNKAFYHAELKYIFIEKSIDIAEKKSDVYTYEYSDEKKKNIKISNFLLSLVKNYLVMNYASFNNYITRESTVVADYKEGIIKKAKRDYYLKHLVE